MQDCGKLTIRQKIGQTMIMLPNRERELEIGSGSLNTYFERVDTCINAYSRDEATLAALAGALAGEIAFKGVSPVRLTHSTRWKHERQ